MTWKVGKRLFSQAAQPDFSLKEKHRNERKGTSKLASCHQAPVWSPFAFLRAIRQQALIKKGYVFEHSPFPRDECPSLSHCNHFLWARKPQTKACLFLPTSVSAETETQHIFMRLCGISCFVIMKERIVSASQRWNMWHQEMVWGCYSLVWEDECVFLARGIRGDAIQKLVGQFGMGRGRRQRAVWRTRRNIDGSTNKNNNSIILLPSFAKILEHTKYILAKGTRSLKVRKVGLYLLDSSWENLSAEKEWVMLSPPKTTTLLLKGQKQDVCSNKGKKRTCTLSKNLSHDK